jgi:hypothetical protein
MRKTALLVVAICGLTLSCGGRSVAPSIDGKLEVFVLWQEHPVADRQLMIVELNQVRWTDAEGSAVFQIPAGSYTLRAFVNSGGLSPFRDMDVTVQPGVTERVEVADCLPCVSPF